MLLKRLHLALEISVFEALQYGIERCFKTFKNRRDEARCHDSSSSNRNFRPPGRASIVSSWAAMPACCSRHTGVSRTGYA
ncbi:MAG: hypothetical protein OZ929_17550 [Bryobacterales bacterium]|nr:hypothetical protein [Bryobacterales bacterium]